MREALERIKEIARRALGGSEYQFPPSGGTITRDDTFVGEPRLSATKIRDFAAMEEGHNIPGHPRRREHIMTEDREWIEDTFGDAIPFVAQIVWLWFRGRANLVARDYWGREMILERVSRAFAPHIQREIDEAGTAEELPDISPPEAFAHVQIGDIVGYDPKLKIYYYPLGEAVE